MNCRKAIPIELSTIANLKLKMFKEVGMENILMDGFLEEVEQTYSDLYAQGNAQHFVIEDNNQIIACAGAFIKEIYHIVFTKNVNMDLLVTFMLNPLIGKGVMLGV